MIDGRRARERRNERAAATPPTAPRRSFGAFLVGHGVRADAVTAFGVLLAAATGAFVAVGDFWAGAAFLTVGGLMDTLDGKVAAAAGTSSPRGAFLDSVSDRVSDGLMLSGVAWYLLSGHHPRLAMLPLAIFAVGSIVSYERAKAESLGYKANGGLMERAERVIVLGLAILFHVVLVPILWALLVLTSATAIGRFVRVWKQATGVEADHPRRDHARALAEARWRSWRTSERAAASRRGRREFEPLSTRLRGVLGVERPAPGRRDRAGHHRSATALRRRVDDGR